MRERPVLPWWAGGLCLGAVLLFAVATVKPLGVSTEYVRAAGGVAEIVSPGVGQTNAYFREEKVVFGYAEWLILGVPVGAVVAALASGRLRRRTVPATWAQRFGASAPRRFAAAAGAGFLLLFGARLANGCTSGHILSGLSQLAVSSMLFFVAAFGVAVLTARGIHASRTQVHP